MLRTEGERKSIMCSPPDNETLNTYPLSMMLNSSGASTSTSSVLPHTYCAVSWCVGSMASTALITQIEEDSGKLCTHREGSELSRALGDTMVMKSAGACQGKMEDNTCTETWSCNQ